MTKPSEMQPKTAVEARPSLLPFNPADLVAMRVKPAQFARMVGVSKQCVSQWVRRGVITLGPDGKIDPTKASREVIERTDPGRLRARVFKQATASHDELRQRIAELESALADEKAKADWVEYAAANREKERASTAIARLEEAMLARFPQMQQASTDGRLARWVEELVVVEYYGQSLDEYRAAFPENEEVEPCPSVPIDSAI